MLGEVLHVLSRSAIVVTVDCAAGGCSEDCTITPVANSDNLEAHQPVVGNYTVYPSILTSIFILLKLITSFKLVEITTVIQFNLVNHVETTFMHQFVSQITITGIQHQIIASSFRYFRDSASV